MKLRLTLSFILIVTWLQPVAAQKKPDAPAKPAPEARPPAKADATRDSFLDTRLKSPTKTTQPAASSQIRLGLGYTIFKQSQDGSPVRASTQEEFHKGDRLRLVIEPNADGYLYVFNSENGGEPEMIFPNPRLNGGRNRIVGHVQYELPSSRESNTGNRWFEVQGEPATEHLFFVITRAPLAGVPAGPQLLATCRGKLKICAWRPTGSVWDPIAARLDGASLLSKRNDPGHAQSAIELESAARGIRLPPDAPQPSVIMMNDSAQTKMLVLKVDLIHK